MSTVSDILFSMLSFCVRRKHASLQNQGRLMRIRLGEILIQCTMQVLRDNIGCRGVSIDCSFPTNAPFVLIACQDGFPICTCTESTCSVVVHFCCITPEDSSVVYAMYSSLRRTVTQVLLTLLCLIGPALLRSQCAPRFVRDSVKPSHDVGCLGSRRPSSKL